jgi:hypothetical protein
MEFLKRVVWGQINAVGIGCGLLRMEKKRERKDGEVGSVREKKKPKGGLSG